MSKREDLIEAIRRGLDPSQEGIVRECFRSVSELIRAQDAGLFFDEIHDIKHPNGEPLWRLTLLDDKGNRSIFDDIDE